MLNFRNTSILFAILLAGLIAYHILHGVPIFYYVILLFVYLLILAYGSYFIQAGFYIESICSAKTDKKEIALSFDDGPANQYTPAILELLSQYNIQAAFFCIGSRIPNNEALFRKLHENGHIIGNHSYSHYRWFDLFSSQKMLNDMQLMNQEMARLTGLTPRLFRPPYGVTNPNLKKAIIKGNYISVGWNVRSFDTVIRNEKKLMRRVRRLVRPGSIILFHDTSETTVKILAAFIRQLLDEGYTITRLDKMLKLEPYV